MNPRPGHMGTRHVLFVLFFSGAFQNVFWNFDLEQYEILDRRHDEFLENGSNLT